MFPEKATHRPLKYDLIAARNVIILSQVTAAISSSLIILKLQSPSLIKPQGIPINLCHEKKTATIFSVNKSSALTATAIKSVCSSLLC